MQMHTNGVSSRFKIEYFIFISGNLHGKYTLCSRQKDNYNSYNTHSNCGYIQFIAFVLNGKHISTRFLGSQLQNFVAFPNPTVMVTLKTGIAKAVSAYHLPQGFSGFALAL